MQMGIPEQQSMRVESGLVGLLRIASWVGQHRDPSAFSLTVARGAKVPYQVPGWMDLTKQLAVSVLPLL
jgi:hypothetical protein